MWVLSHLWCAIRRAGRHRCEVRSEVADAATWDIRLVLLLDRKTEMTQLTSTRRGFSGRTWAAYFSHVILWTLALALRVGVRVALFFLANDLPEATDKDDSVNPKRAVRLSLWSSRLDRRDWSLRVRLFALCGRSVSGSIVHGQGPGYWVPSQDFRSEGVQQVDLTSDVGRVEFVCWPLGRSTVVVSSDVAGRRWLSTRTSNLERLLQSFEGSSDSSGV